ncbi:fimbrial assembly protein [Paraburkholderia hayleyella]|uniref:fimbrial assembly protein n=1 Tax=Paraburkholderia hayleyella TaxID=2152889 RepID=UPI0012927B9F|nr:fimbrial assembly protein [Paraburkholderia hayleyella]
MSPLLLGWARTGKRQPRALRRLWLGGFNLLPYRQRDARRARQRCLIQGCAAAVAGLAAVAAVAGWHAIERIRTDTQRAVLEHSLAQLAAPLAEHEQLKRNAALQRQLVEQAAAASVPTTRLLVLLYALGHMAAEGVTVHEMQVRGQDARVLASAPGHMAAAAWLKQLSLVPDVKNAEMNGLRRANDAVHNTRSSDPAPVEFAVRWHWGGSAAAGAPGASDVSDASGTSSTSGATSGAAGSVRGAR